MKKIKKFYSVKKTCNFKRKNKASSFHSENKSIFKKLLSFALMYIIKKVIDLIFKILMGLANFHL